MSNSNAVTFDDPEGVARAAAGHFAELAGASISDRGRFSVALAGGSTPKLAYELLASEEYRDRIDWSRVFVFFGDERCVPPDHPDSNYRMATESLLAHVSIPLENVYRMKGELYPADSARLYEQELRAFFPNELWPRLDLVLLGMGDDGHTASLFPGSAALKEDTTWVAANWVEKFGTFRLTLTVPVINHAAHIIFLVTGEAKARRLAEVIPDARGTDALPSQLIRPVDGLLNWFVDKAAATYL
jgi:6-phosphogluconolactonase